MVIAKNFEELANCVSDLICGYYSKFKFKKTTFKMNEEDGSIKLQRGPKTKVLLPSSEDLSEEEMIEEIIEEYKKFL